MRVAAVLVLAAGTQLFVLTDHTERYFSWTVEPPLTAAVLGAFYWTSLVLLVASLGERTWARVRVAVPGVFVFTALTLAATLLHLGKFHFESDDAVTLFATWAWLVVYAVVPPVFLAMLVLQVRAPGAEPARVAVPPRWFLAVLGMLGAVAIGFGAALFAAPEAAATVWPWTLTALTGRALGAWLVGIGLVLAQGAAEADWPRLRAALVSAILFGLLQAMALARYAEDVEWGEPGAWLYVAFVAGLSAMAIYGWLRTREARRRVAAGPEVSSP